MSDGAFDLSPSPTAMGKSPNKRSLYRNQDETNDSTQYNDYPMHKPFINDDYERPINKPVSTYPEGNRKVVITALKNLQSKINQLDLERNAAEDNLKALAMETNRYRDILQRDHENVKPTQTVVSKQNQELESQLTAAETRCNLLEKQLDYMRTMVTTPERDRREVVSHPAPRDTPTPPPQPPTAFQENLRKVADLEREHLKLTANQSLAEGKIRELEEKLGEERHHRKLMVEKAAELESATHTSRILQEATMYEDYNIPTNIKPKKKKKKKTVVSKKKGVSEKPDAAKHYRLNLADIPFVAGKNTGPSYSVGANVQRVFSLMKNHNMALCSRASHPINTCGPLPSPSSSGTMSPTTETELAEILLQLQDEFHQMSFEHQELSKEISNAGDLRLREDLERELDALVSRMEAKSHQISRIRKHQERIQSKKKKKKQWKKCHGVDAQRPQSAAESYDSTTINSSPRYNGEVEVTTTIKSKGTGSGVVRIRPSSAREISLNVLKDMKKLQTTLRKDDLSWE